MDMKRLEIKTSRGGGTNVVAEANPVGGSAGSTIALTSAVAAIRLRLLGVIGAGGAAGCVEDRRLRRGEAPEGAGEETEDVLKSSTSKAVGDVPISSSARKGLHGPSSTLMTSGLVASTNMRQSPAVFGCFISTPDVESLVTVRGARLQRKGAPVPVSDRWSGHSSRWHRKNACGVSHFRNAGLAWPDQPATRYDDRRGM